MDFALPHKIAHYTLTQRLGQGGMGVVYRARDERLGRDVAFKMIAGLSDEAAVKRFWREARAAAAVSHPNVCQIFEVDESPEGVYLSMELLAGEALDERLRKAACAPKDAVNIAVQMLAALGALHTAGMVHRDIKPSNVFLTPHGVKLLDFGLARQVSDATVRIDPSTDITGQITKPGMMVGTPRYMSPEQIRGQIVDQRSDLYAVGTLLFEMIAGRPPFLGENVFDLAQGIMHNNPPALQGPPAVIAVDRVIRRAMAKDPSERFPAADAMAAELKNIPMDGSSANAVSTIGTLLRVVVPPLRLQREDADAQFLSYGLAEAVSGSLAAHRDIVVRSPGVAAKWTAVDSDLRQLAQQADVDVVVSGTLSRMGDQLRAQLQAIEAKSGTVLGATSVRGLLSEVFAFEDELTKGVMGLLTPLRSASSGRGTNVHRDVPATPRAFEQFLRGLELARAMTQVPEARKCFEQALEEDPAFAPAWAWLGRCHRIVGKYIENYIENDSKSEAAFQRALALSPELPVAHRFYTHWESEHGRADAAVARLLKHAQGNRNDAQLFAALVHACRYGGLLGASMAAHKEARRLDPTVHTSVEYTLLMLGDVDELNKLDDVSVNSGAHAYLLVYTGNAEDLRRNQHKFNPATLPAGYRGMIESMMSIEADPQGALKAMDDAMAIGASKDPEAVLLQGMLAALLKVDDRAVSMIVHAVDSGFAAVHVLENAPVLERLRGRHELQVTLEHARQRQRIALAVFERGGGPELLGITPMAAL
jgi:serine/threonine protein kinase/tetratricopeptide (TPR) repeat protein